MQVLVGLGSFVLFAGCLLGLVIGLSTASRNDFFAPPVARPPRSHWPLLCTLHLYHRWRTYHSEAGRYQRCSGCGLTRDAPTIPTV